MKTELFTVSKIFNETLFRIPDFQRGYSWEEIHLKDFWSDIEQIVEGKSHYTGVLTLEEVPASTWTTWLDDAWIIKSRRYTPYYVVDGQQRLTTVTILLHTILNAASQVELNYTPIEAIRKKYIFDQKANSNARAYMFGYEKDNPSYEYLKTKIFDEHSDKHSTEENTIYTRNLRNAKAFFEEKIQSLSQEMLDILFTKVTQQLVFNVYEISKEIDVSVAFETMNNRGKPLSTLELLKNRLIYLATQISGDTDEESTGEGERLRRIINDAWKTVYHNLGKNEKRPLGDDEFLRTHFAVYYHTCISQDFPSDPDEANQFMVKSARVLDNASHFLLAQLFTRRRFSSVADGELPQVDSQLLNEYAGHLKRSVEAYFKISTPDADGYTAGEKILLEKLGRLRGYNASPLMLALYLLEKKPAKRVELLSTLERFQFLITMKFGPQRANHINRYLNLEFIKFLKGKATSTELVTFYKNNIDQLFKEDSVSDLLQDWIKNGLGYYGWRSINYFLFEYESHLKNQSKTNRSKIDWDEFSKEDYQLDYRSVEHVYPQRARDPYWTSRFTMYSNPQKRMLRNSLGNLVALSSPKNSSLGNKSFPQKVGREEDTVGYRYGSYSENEVAAFSDWGPEQILERGLKMLAFLEANWGIPIGDREQKIKALGLSFMIKK